MAVDYRDGKYMDNSIIPEVLYKYCGTKDGIVEDYVKESVLLGCMSFSKPLKMNDPFEGVNAIKYAYYTINGDLIHEDIGKELNHILNPIIKESSNSSYSKHEETYIKKQLEKMYVGCLSKDSNSILMWSHYSDAHKGLCIEYETKSLMDQSNNVYRINYVSSINEMLPSEILKNPAILLSFKSKDWEYEKEYRYIIISDDLKEEHIMVSAKVRSIILGLMFDKNKNASFICKVKALGIPIYEMEQIDGFKIRRKIENIQ